MLKCDNIISARVLQTLQLSILLLDPIILSAHPQSAIRAEVPSSDKFAMEGACLRSCWGPRKPCLSIPSSHLFQNSSRRLIELPVSCTPLLVPHGCCWPLHAAHNHKGPVRRCLTLPASFTESAHPKTSREHLCTLAYTVPRTHRYRLLPGS